jgi:hypothetical protein
LVERGHGGLQRTIARTVVKRARDARSAKAREDDEEDGARVIRRGQACRAAANITRGEREEET